MRARSHGPRAGRSGVVSGMCHLCAHTDLLLPRLPVKVRVLRLRVGTGVRAREMARVGDSVRASVGVRTISQGGVRLVRPVAVVLVAVEDLAELRQRARVYSGPSVSGGVPRLSLLSLSLSLQRGG